MKNRFKHKLAWWLRKLAERLEPTINVAKEKTWQYRGTEYSLYPLRLELDVRLKPWDDEFSEAYNKVELDHAYRNGASAIGKAATHLVEIKDEEGPYGDRVILQLLTLKKVNHDK